MEQKNGGSVAAVAHIDRCFSDVNPVGLEALEHTLSLPVSGEN
jgi:hypothetical protein